MSILILCAAGWTACQSPGLVPTRQCEAMVNLSLPTVRAMCVLSSGEVRRSVEFGR
jgi:hypothetical protein